MIVGTGWSLLLQKKGAINEILANFGIDGPDWLADPKIAMFTLLLLISWKYIGFAVILMLAGMQSIPEELYEAARVDGAGFWQMQKSITLPLLAPTLRIWVFLSMIGSCSCSIWSTSCGANTCPPRRVCPPWPPTWFAKAEGPATTATAPRWR